MRRKGFYFPQGLPVRRRLFLVILLFFALAGLQAQVFRPNADNVFVDPGGSAGWNVLSNDELGTNHWSEVTVDIVTYPHHAVAGTVYTDPSKYIYYTPASGFWGRDSLEYSVYCPDYNQTKTAWVYIHVTNQPDNIHTDVCTTVPPKQIWGIDYMRTNEINLSPYQNVVVGDIDGDGIVEILTCMDAVDGTVDGVYRSSYQIAVYKGTDLSIPPRVINTVKRYTWNFYTKYGIVKTHINNRDSTLIVVAEGDLYLRAYNYNGDLVWTSTDTYHTETYAQEFASPTFADLNHDGIPEILVCGKIFNSVTGELLCAAPHQFVAGYNLSIPLAVDLYDTGTMNVIMGNYIYTISPDLSTLILIKHIMPAMDASDPDVPAVLPAFDDGGLISTVDMDNDGKLDFVGKLTFSSAKYSFIYIADPETGIIKASKYVPNAGEASYPFIGDIDGDGYPEIVMIKNIDYSTSDGNRLILAYKYVPGNPVLQEFWRLDHTDKSGDTGITLFDFNQDGISELVYRDETHLRIINGSLKSHITGQDTTEVYNLAIFDCGSGTRAEYPVIADVDGDGQAEILIVGSHPDIPGTAWYKGCLWIFKSGFPEESPWAPARRVWNQYAFNPVNVNEDLSVPRYPLSPATEFVTKSGRRHRPFNNFLQQATMLNDEGEPLSLAADIAFVFGYPASTVYMPATGEVEVSLFVVNQGNASTAPPLHVSVYALKNDGTYVWLHTEEVAMAIVPGQQTTTEFSFPYTLNTDYTGFEVRLNEKDGAFFFEECLTSNNYARGKMFSPDERIICEGDTELIELYPQGMYRYEWRNSSYALLTENTWYTSGTGAYRIGTNGESLEITKNADAVETFYLLLYDLATDDLLSMDFEEVCIYLSPDSLVWTGSESPDWHNYGNWKDPWEADPDNPVHPTSKIPRKCTNVLIPDGLDTYPDLSASATTYYYYPTSGCANITFEHGGEVIRTDSLDYDAAYVHQRLAGNRWYMLSPPLGDFYPGDYYIHDPNPHLDDVYIYTAFFGRSNPESSAYVEGEWTGTFNTPGIRFSTGTGFAVWVDDKQPDATIHDAFDFYFPKYDTGYGIYSWEGSHLATNPVERGWHHRFVYEQSGGWDRTTGSITLPVSASSAATKVIVGNPFMAHWNFSAFQAANPIRNYYQVLDGNGQNFSTYFQYGTGSNDPSITISTATPPLDEWIAPMQSILVESTSAFSSLTTHVTHMGQRAGAKLRSAPVAAIRPLYIDASINGYTNRTLLLRDAEGVLEKEQVNVSKVLLKESLSPQLDGQGNPIPDYPYPVSVYTLSGEGHMLDMQLLGQGREVIPLGICTLQQGTVRLCFEGVEGFFPGYELYLVDTGKGDFTRSVSLSRQPWYEFHKKGDELFLHERLYLQLVPIGTSPGETPVQGDVIRLLRHGSMLRLLCTGGEPIEGIRVTDLQGHVLFFCQGIGEKEVVLHPPLGPAGFYLIHCHTASCSRVFKIHY